MANKNRERTKSFKWIGVAVLRGKNWSLSTAEMVAKLVKPAKEMRTSKRGLQELGLRLDEVAFCDAAAQTDSELLELGDESPSAISRGPAKSVRQ